MTDEVEVQATDESVDQPLSVRDELNNALKETKERADSVEKVETEKPTRARDETGKFSKKTEIETETIEKSATQAPIETTTEQAKPITAPQSWSAAAKTKWAEIPADIQAEITRREEEVHKGFTRLDEERNFGKSLKEVITPYMPMIIGEGGNPASAVQNLLNTAYQLRTGTAQQKGALIRQLAQQFGADMTQIESSAYVDPQLQTLQQRLDTIERQRQQETQYQQQQQQATIQSEIAAFAADPAHPHYETVKAHMAALLRGGVATDLKDAYDQAVYARPDIRSTLLNQQQADAEAKRLADIKAKTQAARNASSSVTGAPGVAVANKAAPERNLREELKANFRAAIQ